jgi:hypothetical protein
MPPGWVAFEGEKTRSVGLHRFGFTGLVDGQERDDLGDAFGVEREGDGAADEVDGGDGAFEGHDAIGGIDVDLQGGEILVGDELAVDDRDETGVVDHATDFFTGGDGLVADDAAGLFEVGFDVGGRELPLDQFGGDGVLGFDGGFLGLVDGGFCAVGEGGFFGRRNLMWFGFFGATGQQERGKGKEENG